MLEGKTVEFEEARSLNQTLTFQKTNEYFSKKNLDFGSQQKRTLRLIGPDSTYTNLAMLLSEQCTHTIKLATFQGSKKTVFRDRCEVSGSLLAQLEDAFSYIDRYNRIRSEIHGLERVDTRDYPVEAIREALLNAIVHRDYAFSAPTLISIFDDRIEMVTIGGLPKGLEEDDILLGVSLPRNQQLANVFYRLKLIEAYGTGLMKIQECYADAPVKPQIDISNHAFKITLPNINHPAETQTNRLLSCDRLSEAKPTYGVSPIREREQQVLQLFHVRNPIVRKDVEKALGVSQATAILILREMVEKGLLIKRGGGKQVQYYPGTK